MCVNIFEKHNLLDDQYTNVKSKSNLFELRLIYVKTVFSLIIDYENFISIWLIGTIWVCCASRSHLC